MPTARFAGVLLLALASGRAQAPDAAAGKCRVAGQVVHFSAGTPVRKVSVQLKRFGTESGVSDTPGVANYSTTSDVQGKFSFDAVEPGVYWLYADRTGYLEQSYGAREPLLKGAPLRLAAGQNRSDLVIKLTPQSFIYGKVADEDGDIVPNAQVQVYKSSWAQGHKRLSIVASAISQDDGSFVVGNVQAGRYYLSADQPHPVSAAPPEPAGLRETYATTYYPNVPDPAAAAPVEVGAGAEVRGIEIRMRLARAFHIRGKAINTVAGTPAAQVYLKLTPADRASETGHMEVGAVTGSDGMFDFPHVSPGAYTVTAGSVWIAAKLEFTLPGQPPAEVKTGSAGLIGRLTVQVGEQDVENLVVPLGEGALVTGSVRMENEDSTKLAPWPTLSLTPVNGSGEDAITAQVKPDGTLRIPSLVPDHYSVEVSGLTDDIYVKWVRFDGRDVTGEDLNLTSGAGGQLDVVLSPNAGTVSGVVRDADGQASAGATVQICAGDDTVKYVRSNENGEFKAGGLRPGDYSVLAWEEVDQGLSLDPLFRAHFASQAAEVKVAEHGRQSADVKMIAREAIESEAAKLK